ncbi:hypothetical protein M1L60_25880 [Actinoplanes sp. TRM 88003]|uniref:DUF4352 domain-containing protein n=1 Tax=Paractinoplanes aksuensis TaxID=2939490 RepID=A0ABT1DT74_9ACTN|nr:hypothetical protein [Actinoplanes aksuensis]MCO8274034.1 hypothetical protein [Actinoplanes aksuensis]
MSAVVTSLGIAVAAVMSAASAGVAVADDQPAFAAPAAEAAAPAAPTPVAAAPAASVPVAAEVAATPVPAIADRDPALKYKQDGKVVTIARKGAKVATVTLKSATYAKKSTKAVLSVAATRPFTINPAMFTLYDTQGWENDPTQTKPVRFEAGTRSLTLNFKRTQGDPAALGWVPQYGEAAVAVWER